MKRLLPIFVLIAFTNVVVGQEVDISKYRTIDGTHNNLSNTEWGSAGENLKLLIPQAYTDGISLPAGLNRPNPREVSNVVSEQLANTTDPLGISDFCWVWGQFLDHDIGLTPDGNEFFPIGVPSGDKMFDPFNTGQMIIPMMRNIFDPATGTSPDNPRRHPNIITAFIDGSNVYGSDKERADWLRSFEGGKLRVSAGNMLPYNTVTGEYEAEVDEAAPHMDDAVGVADKLFVAGDARANENILLLAFHTVFVREHNRLAEELAEKNPNWTDEELYQHARKINGGFIQSIVYNEFLPAMGIHLADYEGYNSGVNPQLSNIFTAAAFRVGHTLLNGNLQRVMLDGTPHPDGPVALRDAFFTPSLAREEGIEIFLKGMGTQMQQELDASIVDDVRNFLFGPPGAGGLDLAAININRGRERGLPDLNTVRKGLGLRPYAIFSEINFSNINLSFNLLASYPNINSIDPWIGMLAERRLPGAIVGETLMEILTRQFTELRDGDRFYYMNDSVLSEEEKEMINKTTLNKILMRNTEIDLMQDNVFTAMPHEQICDNMTVEVLGNVWTEIGGPVANVGINLQSDNTFLTGATSENGRFGFSAIPGCGSKSIRLNKEDNHDNGLSTLDLILVQKHILNRDPLDSPYKLLAADVDMSGSVSTLDLIKMRKVILSIDLTLNNETSWLFIPEHFEFTDRDDPFLDVLPTEVTLSSNGSAYSQNFIAVKLGDVNNSANPNTSTQAVNVAPRSQNMHLQLDNIELQAGEQYNIQVKAGGLTSIAGYQMGLRFNPTAIEVVDIQANGLSNMSEANFAILNREGLIANSWNTTDGEAKAIKAGERLFTLSIIAKTTAKLNEVLQLDSRSIQAEAYGANLNTKGIELGFSNIVETNFALFQNQPNPFGESTQINFYLPAADRVDLTIFDASGRVVLQRNNNFQAGQQQFIIDRSQLGAGGVYYYRVATQAGAATKKMVLR